MSTPPTASRSPFADGPTILMCPPDYYGIEYEINPWMSRSRQSDSELARDQWAALHGILESLGVQVLLQEPQRGMPDLVFTANAGLIYEGRTFVSQFRHEARQPESVVDAEWFSEHGFEVVTLPDGHAFEGAGDALFCGDTLFAGYIIRSDAKSMQWVGSEIGCRVLPLQLVDDRFYHLDTCFCPLDERTALWYPPAFDEYAQNVVRGSIPNLIEAVEEEAVRFCCNAVVVGQTVVHNFGCPALRSRLTDFGFQSIETDLGEFIKAGGSAKCLTLRLDGEQAAGWGSGSTGITDQAGPPDGSAGVQDS